MMIYKVTFNAYSNETESCYIVKHNTENKSLSIPKDGFLINKNQIQQIIEYGNGIRTMKYIGMYDNNL